MSNHDHWVEKIVDAHKDGRLGHLCITLGKTETTTAAATNRTYKPNGEVHIHLTLTERVG